MNNSHPSEGSVVVSYKLAKRSIFEVFMFRNYFYFNIFSHGQQENKRNRPFL
ncbi:MAG: hypothetical protein LBC74_11480 [Planctomycetaceae bacterium]|nr:hypothetical protein [Planctomycetaceae bacterium]